MTATRHDTRLVGLLAIVGWVAHVNAEPVKATMGFGIGALRGGNDSRGRAVAVTVEANARLRKQLSLNVELSSILGAVYLPDPNQRQETMVAQFGLVWQPFSPRERRFDATQLQLMIGTGFGILFRGPYDEWKTEAVAAGLVASCALTWLPIRRQTSSMGIEIGGKGLYFASEGKRSTGTVLLVGQFSVD